MPKVVKKNGRAARFSASAAKYDANHTVLSKTYGALADLRRELAESKTSIAKREEILKLFSSCEDPQRSWLLLEDYFEKLSLSRKDFSAADWWPSMLKARGRDRLEELAILFLRSNRPLPTELTGYANLDRFAEIEQAEQEQQVLQALEDWMFPATPTHLDGPRAKLHVFAEVERADEQSQLRMLKVHFNLFRPRTGERHRNIGDLLDITTRSGHEQELFAPTDWQFLLWLAENYHERAEEDELRLCGVELLQWLARWGHARRLEFPNAPEHFSFLGEVVELTPQLEAGEEDWGFTHHLKLPNGKTRALNTVQFFAGQPALVLADHNFYLVRNPPPPRLLEHWAQTPVIPVRKLSTRMRTQLRKTHATREIDWNQL
jgi:hypothetical protein